MRRLVPHTQITAWAAKKDARLARELRQRMAKAAKAKAAAQKDK